MEPYDVIVNQPVVIDNVSYDFFFILNFAEYIFCTAWIITAQCNFHLLNLFAILGLRYH